MSWIAAIVSVVVGTLGMSDEQYAAGNQRFRRRQMWINAGFSAGSVGQLWNYFAGTGSVLALVSGLGFGFCAVVGALTWRRGLPDTRREDAGAEQ